MADRSFLAWPFFDAEHGELARSLDAWAADTVGGLVDHRDVDGSCRRLVAALAGAGWLDLVVPASHGGRHARLDVRSLCLAREVLAYHAGLADFAFAMQGLGSGPISLAGTDAQKDRWLPPVRQGRSIAAFALSEPDAGSDVAALATAAVPDGDDKLSVFFEGGSHPAQPGERSPPEPCRLLI